MEEFQTQINSLCAHLPQNVPFVMQQVSEAIKVCMASKNAERNLNIAIKVAEQVTKYSGGDMLYNYVPILVALLKDVEDMSALQPFDTVDHAIPISVSIVQQFTNTYGESVKDAANKLVEMSDNNTLVVLANMLADVAEGANILPVAYILLNLNISRVQYINGSFQFYCDLLSAINKAKF